MELQTLLESRAATQPSLTWRDVLASEKKESYFTELLQRIETERSAGQLIYPPNSEVFNALHLTPLAEVKVVIIGQDPYHGAGQAHGLCFSVRKGVRPPPSLKNIFQELQKDLGVETPAHGCLQSWAEQGVLLLNAVLTVRAGAPQSHAQIGWERFTDTVVRVVAELHSNVVFLLWGNYAQTKAKFVDPLRHCVLKAAHPSPFSAYSGFFGCRHFSKANEFLTSRGKAGVDWRIK